MWLGAEGITALAGAQGSHIQDPSLCGCRVSAVTMETELLEEGSRYGDKKSIRSPSGAAAQKHISI